MYGDIKKQSVIRNSAARPASSERRPVLQVEPRPRSARLGPVQSVALYGHWRYATEALDEITASYFLLIYFYFYVDECLAYMYVCLPCKCLVSEKAGRGHGIPEIWSCRWFQVATEVLGTELRSSERAASTLTLGGLSPSFGV